MVFQKQSARGFEQDVEPLSRNLFRRRNRLAVSALTLGALALSAALTAFGQTAADPAGGANLPAADSNAPAAAAESNRSNPFLPYLRRPDGNDPTISGTDCPLTDLLREATTPQARLQTMERYWRLTEKLALYNLAAIHANDVESCIGRYQGRAIPQNAAALWVSARRVANEAKSRTRIEFIAEQYRFAEARRQSRANGRSAQTVAAGLPIPVDPPTVAPYNTRAEQIEKNRGFSLAARRLDAVLPHQYEAVAARLEQVDETLAAYAALYKIDGGSDETLLAALENHTAAKRAMIAAVLQYNRSIASYAAETVGANVQGDRLLMTMNQPPKNRAVQEQTPGAEPQTRLADARPNPTPKSAAPERTFGANPRSTQAAADSSTKGAPVIQRPPAGASAQRTPSVQGTPTIRKAPAGAPAPPEKSPAETRPTNRAAESESPFDHPFGSDDFPTLDFPMTLPESPDSTSNRPNRPTDDADPIIIRGQAPDTAAESTPNTELDLILPTEPSTSPSPQAAAPPPAGPNAPNGQAGLTAEPNAPAAPATNAPPSAAPPTDLGLPMLPDDPMAGAPPTAPSDAPSALDIPNALNTPAPPSAPAAPAPPNTPTAPPPTAYGSGLNAVPSNLPPQGPPAAESNAPAEPASIPSIDAQKNPSRSEAEIKEALQKVQDVSQILFAVDPNAGRAGNSEIVELPLSLKEALSSLNDTPRRLETVESYWALRGETAILLIEQKTLESATTMFDSLKNAGQATPEYEALLATWRAYLASCAANVADARGRIRSEQVTLMTRTGRSPEVGWPIPSSFPCFGPYRLESGASSSRHPTLLCESVLIPEKIEAVWKGAEELGDPSALFAPEISGIGTIDDAYLYLRTLDNKRLAAIGFVRAVESLNNSIARYVGAFSDTPLPSETFVRCLINE